MRASPMWLTAALVASTWFSGLTSFLFAQETKPADAPAAKQPEKKVEKKKEENFIRIVRNDKGTALTMDTAIASYVPADGKHAGVTIDLIGAVHIGEKGYYDALNKKFEDYEVLLFELVAPPNTKIPKGAKGGSAHPIAAMQKGMQSMLGLEHQLECVDYTKDNFVHADMSPEEFSKSMTDRGESFGQMFMKAIGAGLAQQATGTAGTSDFEMLSALFAKNRAQKLRQAMAGQFENMESQLTIFDGPEGSTIVTERNRKAFEVLAKQLEEGKKKIGVFYGAAHLPDMDKRLLADFGMKRKGELTWMKAWTLGEGKDEGKKEEKK
ncbi:TraB/GumN family protein [Anatilimnocola floriformis]|uniref:TraB/GumN family protein n=1 Tax=Anatilimnocola floriformis TaxID=2948575 RepID=UPI0020C4401D|nr:TraB/GumN family protein [Anatilimnocola floriformis]